jgi:hypothetical protein
MNPQDIPMPERLKSRPQWHGYVITYVTFIGPDNTPDFKVVDEKKRRECLQRGLCGICGQKLDERVIVFIGGPLCVQHRNFIDPPMHKECALYSAQVCPYLSDADHDYSKADPKHLGEGETVHEEYSQTDPHRPDRLAVYYCRSYDMVKDGRGLWIAKAGKSFRIDWDVMPKRVVRDRGSPQSEAPQATDTQ